MKTGSGETPRSVAQLFVSLWRSAAAWTPTQRATAKQPNSEFTRSVIRALALEDAVAALTRLEMLLSAKGTSDDSERGLILAVMREIDGYFLRIHPRSFLAAPGQASTPAWMVDIEVQRLSTGCYYEDDSYALIPRGPLLRTQRRELASNADSLADRFAALSVVPKFLRHEERPVKIQFLAVGSNAVTGVSSRGQQGAERVAFIPVAEGSTDLQCVLKEVNGRYFFDCEMGAEFDPANRTHEALVALSTVRNSPEMVIAPEFVTSEQKIDELIEKTEAQGGRLPRLILVGSGRTANVDPLGMPWNEARIINGFGVECWRQRKLWPAAVTAERVSDYGLSPIDGHSDYLEYSASGDELIVADVEGLGRCVTLICQDMMSLPLASDAIRYFQPDWIFCPILDPGIRAGGWIHRRAFELSGISPGRFLIACSTALAKVKDAHTEPYCGLAVGPLAANDETQGREYALVAVEPGTSPGYALLTWFDGTSIWKKTTVS